MADETPSPEYLADLARMERAAHAMQSGVAAEMHYRPEPTSPKHLRVGVNSALVENAALVSLLVARGVFTRDEHMKALCGRDGAGGRTVRGPSLEADGPEGQSVVIAMPRTSTPIERDPKRALKPPWLVLPLGVFGLSLATFIGLCFGYVLPANFRE